MGMENYPRNMLELEKQFSTEKECLEYLSKVRWPEGFICPKCKGSKAWLTNRGLYHCSQCGFQSSIIAGTVFQDTKKPLKLWFRIIWHITSQKYGTNALGIQRVFGLGSYRIVWAWLHKLRCAMVRPGRDRLSGIVDIDETYFGGERTGKRGRGAEGKTLIFVAVESKDNRIGRIRLKRILDASAESLEPAIKEFVEPGSIIHTDGWKGYNGVSKIGYKHEVIKDNTGIGINLLPKVNRVVSLLKRWLLGTYQGRIEPSHLDYYLDEFTFRFNRRTSNSRGMLFYRLIQQAVAITPVRIRDIKGGSVVA